MRYRIPLIRGQVVPNVRSWFDSYGVAVPATRVSGELRPYFGPVSSPLRDQQDPETTAIVTLPNDVTPPFDWTRID